MGIYRIFQNGRLRMVYVFPQDVLRFIRGSIINYDDLM